MLKIQRTANGDVVFALSGRLEPDGLRELSALITQESCGRSIAFDLQDLVLVGREAVNFLRACAERGIELRNCPHYIRAWIASDGR
jgi:hypothetical protein